MTAMHRLAVILVITTASGVLPTAAAAKSPPPLPKAQLGLSSEIVVKVNMGHSISEITSAYPVTIDRAVLASRGIYLVEAPTRPWQATRIRRRTSRTKSRATCRPSHMPRMISQFSSATPNSMVGPGVHPPARARTPQISRLSRWLPHSA